MNALWAALDGPPAFVGFLVLFGVTGLLVLVYEGALLPGASPPLRRWVARRGGPPGFAWVRLPLLTGVAAAGFALAVGLAWATGRYGCNPAGGPSDLLTLWTSGQVFARGGDPFVITACGVSGNPVPAGLASVLLDAVGSLAGRAGLLVVWGAVAVALVPLTWSAAGSERRAATVFLLASFVYFPIVAAQIDGATLALVPVTVLAVLVLSRRGWTRAAAVGGFLSTGRFPAVFPAVAATGRAGRQRWIAGTILAGTFAAVSAATFAVYGSRFLDPVFLLQFSRSSFALNYWGVLEGTGWVVPGLAVTVLQAALLLALVLVLWARGRTELGTASAVLVGTVLLAQFLSFTELVFLVPVLALGKRARAWCWGIGLVAAANYLLVLHARATPTGPVAASYGLDLALTALLLGLFVDVLRGELGRAPSRNRSTTLPAAQPPPVSPAPAGGP